MKQVATAVENAIKYSHDVTAIPRLTAEWNMNRYAETVQVDNDPSDDLEGYDIEMFPVESLVQPNRPTAGIIKARIGEARLADVYTVKDGTARQPRYYLCSADDIYKYWTSPIQTDVNGNFPEDKVKPYVLYPGTISANKIVVGFEDTWAQPENFTIRIRQYDGAPWETVSTNPPINDEGQVVLYWTGISWTSYKPDELYDGETIAGIQVKIDSLRAGASDTSGSYTGKYSHASVIEISARLEVDLTDRLISVGDTFDMAEVSQVYPIGTVTTNTADITLFNGDGLFNSESSSPYRDILEPNVLFNLEYIYHIDGVQYPVQQFRLYGGAWQGQQEETVNIQCDDFSKFFSEIKPLQAMYRNLSVAEIIWRLCDSVGFNNYVVPEDDITTQHKIPLFWVNGEQTVWEVLDELALASQTAIYFDAWGRLQVRTRTNAFNNLRNDWTLYGQRSGDRLPDIVSLEQTDELESNQIKVNYQSTDFEDPKRGFAPQVLWEPEGTVTLRAAPLKRTLDKNDNHIILPHREIDLWPYEGLVNIQGELIRYSGKHYKYYENGVRKIRTVKSQDEKDKYDAKTPYSQRYRNGFTGALVITERGVWNSENKRHPVEAEGYDVRSIINGNWNPDYMYGFYHHRDKSKVTLNPGPRFKQWRDAMYVTRGSQYDEGYWYYGTKMNFVDEPGQKEQIAGLYVNSNGTDEDGYYVEFQLTDNISAAHRNRRHEILLYSRKNGKHYRIGRSRGRALNVVAGREYEIDLFVAHDHTLNLWIDGKHMLAGQVPFSWRNDKGGRFGFFAKGQTKVQFEYLYAIQRSEDQPEDDFSFLDKVRTGYTGGQWDREWVYRWRKIRRRHKKRWTKEQRRWAGMFMDEFGPIVHEVREFDVQFEPNPALTSRLYMGNDYDAICPEYHADSFGAKFYIANTARHNAVIHGEDSLTFAGSGETINPILSVIGIAAEVAEAETVTVRDEEAIRARGIVETEIISPWIQSKEMAEEVANWIKDHWSKGADQLTVTIFGNPLIEVGDVVGIDHAQKNMSPETHKYFVVATSTSFESGLGTTLTLRRVV